MKTKSWIVLVLILLAISSLVFFVGGQDYILPGEPFYSAKLFKERLDRLMTPETELAKFDWRLVNKRFTELEALDSSLDDGRALNIALLKLDAQLQIFSLSLGQSINFNQVMAADIWPMVRRLSMMTTDDGLARAAIKKIINRLEQDILLSESYILFIKEINSDIKTISTLDDLVFTLDSLDRLELLEAEDRAKLVIDLAFKFDNLVAKNESLISNKIIVDEASAAMTLKFVNLVDILRELTFDIEVKNKLNLLRQAQFIKLTEHIKEAQALVVIKNAENLTSSLIDFVNTNNLRSPVLISENTERIKFNLEQANNFKDLERWDSVFNQASIAYGLGSVTLWQASLIADRDRLVQELEELSASLYAERIKTIESLLIEAGDLLVRDKDFSVISNLISVKFILNQLQ